jgi:patatin-like phospholipase
MNDPARNPLLASLGSGDGGLWSIIGELAEKDEIELRTLLRPHEDAGFSAEDIAVDQRSRLDAALGVLTRFELARQLDLISDRDIPHGLPPSLARLFDSQSFLRYVNAYLYFGIRFLAGRIHPPAWMIVTPRHPPERDKNERPIALVKPPKIPGEGGARAAMDRFLVLQSGDEANRALRFLDGFIKDDEEPDRFELWLRGLYPEVEGEAKSRFNRIGDGLTQWSLERSEFYKYFQPSFDAMATTVSDGEGLQKGQGPHEGWSITNPVAPRFGLADIYWIARLLRADVTADAEVTYKHTSWLRLLSLQASNRGEGGKATKLGEAEDILRQVFDFTCDLIQNALEITTEKEERAYQPELFVDRPKTTTGWRETFDEECGEIEIQRKLRSFAGSTEPPGAREASDAARREARKQGWSQRVQTGEHPRSLVGLAFSGGGIRSATFNLGVLQGLQEFDLLRCVDYLSTVSGGGFIGSWLIANVNNASHWLGRLTNWDESIAHLRRYSKYLAPSTGVMSADTWTMWFSWLRNAFLIQLTGVACLAALLVFAVSLHRVFLVVGDSSQSVFGVRVSVALLATTAFMVAAAILFSLGRTQERKWLPALATRGICLLGVLPAWIGSFLIASLLWNETLKTCGCLCLAGYSDILKTEWQPWLYPLEVAGGLLAVISLASTSRGRWRWNAIWIAPFSTGALYLEYCGIVWLFHRWTYDQNEFGWYAFIFGPALVLAANAVGVVLFIGFCGRYSAEWIREWWTRFGSWLAMYGIVLLIIGVSAVFGPLWILYLFGLHWKIAGVASAGWVGTVVSALFAGKSDKTSGDQSKSRVLQILAVVGGLLFIAGALLLTATLVYVLLVNIGTDDAVSTAQYWPTLSAIPFRTVLEALGVTAFLGIWFSWFFEINIFGLSHFYRNRLVRCYLGATRWVPGLRKPQPFTGFDRADDFALSKLRNGLDYESERPRALEFRGPFPILNCALNLGGSSDLALQTRHSASFTTTPLRCGADRRRVGYAPTPSKGGQKPFAGGVKLGQAVSVSGAAASPNMGYNTSPLVAFLLTMFNVRLGWWFPNPGRSRWNSRGLRSSLLYLLEELFGIADETSAFVNVSDGGHFENLGIYELVRRRCKVIVASDAECDDQLQFGSLGNVLRICETDFGAKIDLDVSSIRKQTNGYSQAHCTVGKITYSNGSLGWLIYLKASVSGDEDVAVAQYRSIHPTFPQESTADQFFSEDQFESYRRLGQHVVRHALRDTRPGGDPVAIAEKLYDVWASTSFDNDVFLKGTQRLDEIWERFRQTKELHPFLNELTGGLVGTSPAVGRASEIAADPTVGAATTPCAQELAIGLELIQLMEDIFLDLRLDDFWEHPDNRGWAMLFTLWAHSPIFRAVWIRTRRTFGIRFEYFCEQRLGLPKERPIARVSS